METQDSSPANHIRYHKRDFWSKENLKYTRPHFRMQKAARLVNRLARGGQVDLLDIGCGPATLMTLLKRNISYHGIDIAITDKAARREADLLEADLLEVPIKFGEKRFGIIVAQGFFEYMGTHQSQKFTEIRDLLTHDGVFLVSYVNFGHRRPEIYWPYSNVQPLAEFRKSLSQQFDIRRSFPTAHNWRHSEPNRLPIQATQLPLNVHIPVVSAFLGVEYFFICNPKH